VIKIISWNVNGIRAVIKKGFLEFIETYNPDILCIQETKAHPDQVDLDLSNYPYKFWSSAEKKGYSGTAIFSKIKPIKFTSGLNMSKHDSEGRVITLEFKNYFLINVYTPNSKRELTRLDYRYNEWDPDFLAYLKSLEEQKPIIFCGDLNVAHREIDLANPQTNKTTKSRPGNAGFTDKERESFENIIDSGFIDTFRVFNKDPEHYSWWSYRANARARNIGWRIDYVCVSDCLKSDLKKASILPEVFGSDHAPVLLDIDI
tara:strand:- start:24 stop:803 length:780 start_codon:yes stop_codon:yes gene_type:complete